MASRMLCCRAMEAGRRATIFGVWWMAALLTSCAAGDNAGDDAMMAAGERRHLPAGEAGPPPSAPTAPTAEKKTDLFYRTFGDSSRQPVIFMHGGPGSSDIAFEVSGAQALADRGFFVVTYDQRGGGRSPKGTREQYSYAGASQDLDDLIGALKLKSPALLPNSFGG